MYYVCIIIYNKIRPLQQFIANIHEHTYVYTVHRKMYVFMYIHNIIIRMCMYTNINDRLELQNFGLQNTGAIQR